MPESSHKTSSRSAFHIAEIFSELFESLPESNGHSGGGGDYRLPVPGASDFPDQ
jgi:hypothetical protein